MKRIAIKEVCEVYDGPHATPKKTDNGPVYLGIDAITEDGMLDPSQFAHLSEEDYVKWTKRVTPQENDIVFSYEATLGRYAVIPKNFYGCLGRRLAIVRIINDELNAKWLYYYFRSPEWTSFIKNQTVKGSTVDRISIEEFPEYTIPVISLEDQNKIVDVLDKIDRKIADNKKINDYLEEMAKALYDYWFVQFDFPDKKGKPYKSSGGALLYNEVLKKEIPFGWTIDTLGNLLSKVPNSTKIPATDFCDKGSIPVIDQSSDFIAGYTDDETSLLSNKTGYIVFGDHTRVVKYIRFPFARGADGTQVINSNNRCMPNELFYQVIKSIDLSNYGYARHFKYLKDTIIAIPSANLADIYAEKVGKWYEKQVSIMKENIALSQLRDWLLPMLMNGQATIEN